MSKLTLSAPKNVIALAKKIAAQNNTSVSSMFERLIRFLAVKLKKRTPIGPLTRELTGVISAAEDKTDREILEEALLEKYDIKRASCFGELYRHAQHSSFSKR